MNRPLTVVVVLGAPHTPLNALGDAIAQAEHGLHTGDLQISHADTVGGLLQVYEMAQVPLHEPLYAFLREHVAAAAAGPEAWLRARADWSFARLLHELLGHVRAPLVVFSDAAAGLRIHQAERWTAALPQAFYVHAVTAPGFFAEAARAAYEGRLYVPPDYRDYCIANGHPVFRPVLAWMQVHRTLARLVQDSGLRWACYALERLPSGQAVSLRALMGLPPTPAAAADSAATVESLAEVLGYGDNRSLPAETWTHAQGG